jgi:hypothetical protein
MLRVIPHLISLNVSHIAISSEADLQKYKKPTSFIAQVQQAV